MLHDCIKQPRTGNNRRVVATATAGAMYQDWPKAHKCEDIKSMWKNKAPTVPLPCIIKFTRNVDDHLRLIHIISSWQEHPLA